MGVMDRISRTRFLVDERAGASGILPAGQPDELQAMPSVPAMLLDHVLFGQEPGVVYVDGRYAGAAAFLTWADDVRAAGFAIDVRVSAPQELAELRGATSDAKRADDAHLDMLALSKRRHADAAALGASDMHVLIRDNHTEVQLRIDGELWAVPEWEMTTAQGEAFVRATCSGLATVKPANFNPLEFQDAQIAGSKLDQAGVSSVRVTRGPAYPNEAGGAFMVSRVQYRRLSIATADRRGRLAPSAKVLLEVPASPAGEVDFVKMGFTEEQSTMFEEIVRMPDGLFIQTGPTGSGKSTTTYELLRYKAQISPELRQVTIENPIEYPLDWGVQLLGTGQAYDYLVSRTLRMDPDVILVGEMRTADESVATIQAAQTGHLVFSTLHEVDPFESIARFEMLDHARLSRPMICNHKLIVGFMGQRMVPQLCTSCKQPLSQAIDIPNFLLERIKSWGRVDEVCVRGQGCSYCEGRKTKGRKAVAEIVITTEELMEDFLRHDIATARRNHRRREGSDKSMLAHVMDRVLAGLVDPRDAHSKVGIEARREGR